MQGKLIIVPTPVGNLEDITLRSIRMMKEADFILAEDTRTSRVLMNHHGIDKQLRAYHQHNEHKVVEDLVNRLLNGNVVALVSDAGTPGISDPGFLIVRECIKAGIRVECLPGPTAFVPALINSGLPSERFCFEGFLPQKKGRSSRLEELKDETRTMVFYESPFRLVKTLVQFAEVFGSDRQASVSREISKMFEETRRGTLTEISEYFNTKTVKGEIVIVVKGKDQ